MKNFKTISLMFPLYKDRRTVKKMIFKSLKVLKKTLYKLLKKVNFLKKKLKKCIYAKK